MPLPLSLLAAAVLSTAAAAQTTPAGADQDLIVANADGSWTITADIHEAPVSLALLTDGLLEDEDMSETHAWPLDTERERMREREQDDQVERAFEEAIDAVTRPDPR